MGTKPGFHDMEIYGKNPIEKGRVTSQNRKAITDDFRFLRKLVRTRSRTQVKLWPRSRGQTLCPQESGEQGRKMR